MNDVITYTLIISLIIVPFALVTFMGVDALIAVFANQSVLLSFPVP